MSNSRLDSIELKQQQKNKKVQLRFRINKTNKHLHVVKLVLFATVRNHVNYINLRMKFLTFELQLINGEHGKAFETLLYSLALLAHATYTHTHKMKGRVREDLFSFH